MCSHVETYSQCQIPFCYTGGLLCAGATYPCRANPWHVVTHGTCEFRCLVQFILVGAVYHNALTNCATLLCRACLDEITCVAERYLTLRTGCERYGRKNPLPYPISERSHVGNLRRANKQGKGRSSKRKENRRLSFLFAHRRGYGVVPRGGRRDAPAAAAANPTLRFSEKLSARQGRTR